MNIYFIYTTITLFGMTTIMGLYLSSLVLRNKQTPKGVIIAHGLITITGFILLSSFYPPSLKSILFFSIATMCGLILCYQDLTGKKFSKWLCFAHAFMTITGFIFLIRLASGQ